MLMYLFVKQVQMKYSNNDDSLSSEVPNFQIHIQNDHIVLNKIYQFVIRIAFFYCCSVIYLVL